jgi:nucleoside-diphosphate-sugar epimerase
MEINKIDSAMDSVMDSAYDGRRVVVLGATGFIGRWLSKRLGELNAEVYSGFRNKEQADKIFRDYNIKGYYVEVNLEKREIIEHLFKEIQPEIVFNLSGYGVAPTEKDESTAFEINANSLTSLLELTQQYQDKHKWRGQALVHVGSGFEYGTLTTNLDEESEVQATSLYARSKSQGTAMVQAYSRANKLPCAIARPFTVYGPGERPHRLLPGLIDCALTGSTLDMSSGIQQRDFIFLDDVVEGLLRIGIAELPFGEIINLATGKMTSVKDFAKIAAQALNLSDEQLRFGEIGVRDQIPDHQPVTIERLKNYTGWVPSTSISEGVKRSFEFTQLLSTQATKSRRDS